MFNARNAVAGGIILLVLIIGVAVWDVVHPPENRGRGYNSYGTRARGQRGLVEILSETGLPIERSVLPPTALLHRQLTVGIIGPMDHLVQTEPGYLNRIADWVTTQGAHVVVALRQEEENEAASHIGHLKRKEIRILEELGLPAQPVVSIEMASVPGESGTDSRKETGNNDEWYVRKPRRMGSVPVETTGDFFRKDRIGTLKVPLERLQVIDHNTTAPQPEVRLSVRSKDEAAYTLAATYQLGKGTISVVSDAEILLNRAIAENDNAVLAYDLFSAPGLPVVMDEFYHGLNQRGNPFWLLTKRNYGLFASMVLLAIGLWIWRSAGSFGPALPDSAVARRNLQEYVTAMGNLFHRGKAKRFVLEELRSGVIWALARQLKLAPGRQTLPDVLAVLSRRDPEKAEQLKRAQQLVQQVLDKKHITDHQMENAARELRECL